MPKPLKAFLFWTPRILGILFILFLMMFSLDIFEMSDNVGEILLGLLMHNLRPLILLVALLIGWRRLEWLPALAFAAFGIWYVLAAHGVDSGLFLMFVVTPILIGLLYLAGWIWRKQIRG
jgi:hypothetical protein